jgi:circadian clock protein KaiC
LAKKADFEAAKEQRAACALSDARRAIEQVLSNEPSASEEEILTPVLQALDTAESALVGPASVKTSVSEQPQDYFRQRMAELEAALRARDEFIATIGHELKNPVTPVLLQVRQLLSMVTTASSDNIATEALLPRLESMLARLRRFLGTLNRILDISRISSGRIDLHLEEIDLVEVVKSIAADMEREIAASQSALTVRGDEKVIGRWDRLRLEQIFSNLLSNAFRYGLGNPIDVCVTTRGPAAVLEVRDRGLGIADEELEIIFERFERGSGVRNNGGFGVGLWVVKRLCRALGGSVEVQSKLHVHDHLASRREDHLMSRAPVERIATGIPILDAILEGGLLKGGVYLVQGPPGSGKTILGNQLCFQRAKAGASAVFVTLLAESHARMLAHLRRMKFFDATHIPERVFYVSGLKILEAEGLSGLTRTIRESVASRGASLLVLDGFVSAEEAAPTPRQLKKFIQEIQSVTAMTDCTALLLSSTERPTEMRPEHTMVDGIIELSDELARLGPLRHLRVRKMRGADQIRGKHTIEITDDGIVVHPRIEMQLQAPPEDDRITPSDRRLAFGVPELDKMLGGGLPENSLTMLIGPSGSGKTILGLQYLAEGARRGEAGVHFGFYEHPEALRRKSKRLNLGVEEMEKEGLIELVWQPPIEGVIDILGERLLSAIKRVKARRLLIDGIQGFQLALDDFPDRIRGVFSALADELERIGVTCVYTVELSEIFGPAIQMPIDGISSATQNMILLRYVELRSRLNRIISIIKVRDSEYDPSIRELRITNTGVAIGGMFADSNVSLASTGPFSGVALSEPAKSKLKKKTASKSTRKPPASSKRKA